MCICVGGLPAFGRVAGGGGGHLPDESLGFVITALPPLLVGAPDSYLALRQLERRIGACCRRRGKQETEFAGDSHS